MGKGDMQRLKSRLRALRQQCDNEKQEAVKAGFQAAVMMAGEYLMKHYHWEESKIREFIHGLMNYTSAKLERRAISPEIENSSKEGITGERVL
jgi:hypothetical protein